MRLFLAMLVLALTLLAAPTAYRADEYDDDSKEGKKGDAKHGTPQEETQREKQRWEAWVKKLGDGPIYRVEVLFRAESDDGAFYFVQHYVSPTLPVTLGMPCVGLNSTGKIVSPYNPMDAQRELPQATDTVSKPGGSAPPLPLAKTTHYLALSLPDRDAKPGNAGIYVSDVATHMPLPKKRGDVEVMFFSHAAFRIERVSADDALKAGPLRQDARYFRDRTEVLKKEILKTQRPKFAEGEHALIEVAYVFRDPDVIDGVRKSLDRWIDLPPNEFAARSFPTHLTYCLSDVGDARDLEAFRRLVRRHPTNAAYLMWAVLRLVDRIGTEKAMPLLEELVNQANPYDADSRIEVMRELNPKIPVPIFGDFFVAETVRHFHLKPTCYELHSTQQTLDAMQKKQPLTDAQQWKLIQCQSTEWLFLTEAERRAGAELILDWYKQYQPPMKK